MHGSDHFLKVSSAHGFSDLIYCVLIVQDEGLLFDGMIPQGLQSLEQQVRMILGFQLPLEGALSL